MSFYIERIIIKNRAPFIEGLELCLIENSVNILSSVNGKGKTTLLSYIMDAWVEMTRNAFSNSYEGRENKYYRISSSIYDLDSSKPSIVYIRFKYNNQNVDYVDIRNHCSDEDYEDIIGVIPNHIPFSSISSTLENNNNVKYSSITSKLAHDIWNNNVITYFPAYRHELPNFLNDCYATQVDYSTKSGFSNTLVNPLEVKCDIRGIVNWLMDITIDSELYKIRKKTSIGEIDETPENIILWRNVSSIVQKALISKYPTGDVRLAISKRNRQGSRVSLTSLNGKHNYCPTIYNLSSGELEVLNIFVEVLRQADNLHNNIALDKIRGIVMVDEIDMHMHIRLQKESLPTLIQLFPNVQFIISSHSPFLNMGLADTNGAEKRSHIFDLDNNGIQSSPTNNDIYKEAYNLFLNEKNLYAEKYKKASEKLAQVSKPLVITEGKTDIKHILKAFAIFGIEVNFDILEDKDQPDGWSNLDALLTQLSKVHQSHKIIGIFDSDVDRPIKTYGFDGTWNHNNVYGFCIPVPQSRKDVGQDKISIEYLYSDAEIHSKLPDGTQLYFGSEFKKDSTRQCLSNPNLRLNDKNGAGEDRIIENNGGQAVYDDKFKNYLGKKDAFAEAICNDNIEISQESWENFKPIIELIQNIINN